MTVTDSVNTRELVLEMLIEIIEKNQYSHLILRDVLDKYQYLSKQERAFMTRLTEGTLEHLIELDYIIDSYSKTINLEALTLVDIMNRQIWML